MLQVNEARDAFDMYDSAEGLLGFEGVGKVLDKLGFDEVGGLGPPFDGATPFACSMRGLRNSQRCYYEFLTGIRPL